MSIETEALEKLYNERDISEKHLSIEHWEKLWSLRQQKDVALKRKQHPSRCYSTYEPHVFEIDETCSIRVKVNGSFKQVGGIVRKVNKDGTCDVSTGFKYYENVKAWQRTKQDMSKVEIPEVLKKIDTKRLLAFLQRSARSYYYYEYDEYHTVDKDLYIEGTHVTRKQVKAELYNREHLVRNDERRDILNSSRERRNYKKNRKKNKRF